MFVAVSLSVLLLSSQAQTPPSDAPRAPQLTPAADVPRSSLKTEEERLLYTLGLAMGRNIAPLNFTQQELEVIVKGMSDVVNNREPQVDPEIYGPKLQQFTRSRAARRAEGEKTRGKEYLEKVAKEPGVTRTASGLLFRDLKVGQGARPKPSDEVRVHYRGTLINGTEFDSSHARGEPAEFPLQGVIPCWTEAVQKMKVGGKARIVCPSDLAYGDAGSPPNIPGGATLIFDVELLEIRKK